jgi:hypothetical protein
MTAYDLFTEHQAKSVRAVQVTEANAQALGTLPGIIFMPETATDEMWFGVRVGDLHTQGISFGDWVSESAVSGQWIVYWGDDEDADEFSDFSRFTDVFESELSNVEAVAAAKARALDNSPDADWTPPFEAGQRVESLLGGHGENPHEHRPGVVIETDHELRVHHYVHVLFDDGEELRLIAGAMRTVATS